MEEDWHFKYSKKQFFYKKKKFFFRIGEKYLGKKHYVNPVYLNKLENEKKFDENYEKNLKILSEFVVDLYMNEDVNKKKLIIEKAYKLIKEQEFPEYFLLIIDLILKKK